MPNSDMKPIIAGMLTSPVVNTRVITPPIKASGRLMSITALSSVFLNCMYRRRNITTMLNAEASIRVRLAACSLSNWPPYSTW